MKRTTIRLFQKIDRKIQGLFIFSILAFVLLAGLIYQQKQNQELRRSWVDHTNQAIKKISTISLLLSEKESLVGAIAGKKDSAANKELQHIHQQLNENITELANFTRDNETEQKNLHKIEQLIHQKETVLQQSVSADIEIQNDLSAKKILAQMFQLEDNLLANRIQQSESSYRSGIYITLAGGVFSFALVLVVLYQLNNDIVRRRKAEEEMRNSEAQYRSLIENAGVVMYTTDTKGKIAFVNQQVNSLTGYLAEELAGKHFSVLLNPSEAAKTVDFYQQQLVSQIPTTHLEFKIQTKTGKEKWVEQSALLLFDDKEPCGFQCMVKDITESKKTEQELSLSEAKRKENEYRLNAIMDNSTALIYIKDLEGKYVMTNKRFKEFFHLTDPLIMGHTNYDFNEKEVADHYKKMDEEVFNTLKPIESEELIETPTGNRNLLLLKFPLLSKEGLLLGISGIATDITEKVESRKEQLAAVKRAESAQQIQEQFLANMSHEIRTPMNGITGMTKLLLDTDLTEDQKSFANMINRSLNNLVVIVNNVLDFSNLKTGKLVLDRIAFSLGDILDEIKKQFAHQIANKKIDFNIFIDQSVTNMLTGDAYRLKQVLANLVGNAIKFTHNGGVQLKVAVQEKTDYSANILFTLSDTGIGIPEDKLDTIFESFAQANKDISRGYGGAGLGLTISKELILLQNGSISVKSKPGEGSVFSFLIPMGIKQDKDEISSSQDTAQLLSGKRFLVVEDNLVNQRLISFVLQKVGGVVDLASNGKEAVTYFENKNTCDLVIMDLQMPVMDGYQAATQIRQQLHINTPIIAMTATALKEDQERSKLVGMNDFIIKPFDFNDLYKRLIRILYNQGAAVTEQETGKRTTVKLYDLSLLEELGDKESLLDVLSLFFDNTPNDVKELKKLYAEKNAEQLSKLAHKIKGAVSILQSARLTELLKNIEMRSKETQDVTTVEEEMTEVSGLFGILERQLHSEWERISKEM